MTEQLLDGLAPDARADLPVLALNDLSFRHTPAAGGMPARIDIAHRDRPSEPLISLDPADASTFVGRLVEQLACAWVHADQRLERIETLHEASALGGVA